MGGCLLIFLFLNRYYDRLEEVFREFSKVKDPDKSAKAYAELVENADKLIAGKGANKLYVVLAWILGLVSTFFLILLPPETFWSNPIESAWNLFRIHPWYVLLGGPLMILYWTYLLPTGLWHLLHQRFVTAVSTLSGSGVHPSLSRTSFVHRTRRKLFIRPNGGDEAFHRVGEAKGNETRRGQGRGGRFPH